MTLTEARKELDRPLTFGDRKQIASVKFIEQVEELVRRAKHLPIEDGEEECDECEGTGYTECCECGNEKDCDECDGTGYIDGPHRIGWDELAEEYSDDVVDAAKHMLDR